MYFGQLQNKIFIKKKEKDMYFGQLQNKIFIYKKKIIKRQVLRKFFIVTAWPLFEESGAMDFGENPSCNFSTFPMKILHDFMLLPINMVNDFVKS